MKSEGIALQSCLRGCLRVPRGEGIALQSCLRLISRVRLRAVWCAIFGSYCCSGKLGFHPAGMISAGRNPNLPLQKCQPSILFVPLFQSSTLSSRAFEARLSILFVPLFQSSTLSSRAFEARLSILFVLLSQSSFLPSRAFEARFRILFAPLIPTFTLSLRPSFKARPKIP